MGPSLNTEQSRPQFQYAYGIDDGVNPVQETSGATVLANILTGLGIDEFLTRTDVPAANTSHFLPDALGSAFALADSAGTVQTEYTYEPFGRTTATGASNINPFQFTGRENDGTGLYHYRARYYHPGLQRFISEDPILSAGNPDVPYFVPFLIGDPPMLHAYVYVGNSPLNSTDPIGLLSKCCEGGQDGIWIGRASRFINIRCKCYWICVPTAGVMMWSGNWFAQRSTDGVLISVGGGGLKRGNACLCSDPTGVPQSIRITLMEP